MPATPSPPAGSSSPTTELALPTPDVLGGPPPKPAGPPKLRAFGDAAATRDNIYAGVLETSRHTLTPDRRRLGRPGAVRPQDAQAGRPPGETLARRAQGHLGAARQRHGLGRRPPHPGRRPRAVPVEPGHVHHRGNEYTVNHQQRLDPGVFARVKDNGELESHVNVLPGKGVSHRYFLDPEKGVFKIRLQQAEMPLLPLLQALGATDNEVREAWGDDLHAEQLRAKDDAGTSRSCPPRLRKPPTRGRRRDAPAAGGRRPSQAWSWTRR
jgi:hypothetical protein